MAQTRHATIVYPLLVCCFRSRGKEDRPRSFGQSQILRVLDSIHVRDVDIAAFQPLLVRKALSHMLSCRADQNREPHWTPVGQFWC